MVSPTSSAMSTKLHVRLPEAERAELECLVRAGTHHARRLAHARVLLLADDAAAAHAGPAWSDDAIAAALGLGVATVARTRGRYVRDGLAAALRVRAPNPGRPPKVDACAEAHLIALACASAPEGRATWSLRLLAEEFSARGVEAGWIEGPVSYETVRRALKKTPYAPTA